MGSLRDELLKKGIADKKRERQVRHQEQHRKKEIGDEAVQSEQAERDAARRAEVEERRRADQEREAARRQQASVQSEVERLPKLIKSGLVPPTPFDNRKYFFVTREQTVSFIEVSVPVMRGLSGGRYAIVEASGAVDDDFCVVSGDIAKQIYEIDSNAVRFWNGTGRVSR